MTLRIAVAGWIGSDNLGDELILRSLIRSLRARGAEPAAVSIDPAGTRRLHGVEAVRHRSPLDTPGLRRAVRRMDGMVAAGGLIQTETSVWNIPFHAARWRAARNIPGAAVGLGAGRVNGALPARAARRALHRMQSIVVRDQASAELLEGWGLRGVRVGSDPVIGEEAAPVDPCDAVCVVLRPANRGGVRTASAAAKAGPPPPLWAGRLAAALDAAAGAVGLPIRMTAFQKSRDLPVLRAAADRLRSDASVSAPGLDDVLEEVGKSRLVITMRYHGAVAALLHGRPAVLLDYSPKMASLAAEGGGWAPLASPLLSEPAVLAEAAERALAGEGRAAEARGILRERLAENDRALDRLTEQRHGRK